MKLTPFEAEELRYKVGVLIDSGQEMFDSINRTESELEKLDAKITSKDEVALEDWERNLLKEEAEDLLTIAEINLDAGFPEYIKDVRKLKKLVNKFEVITASL